MIKFGDGSMSNHFDLSWNAPRGKVTVVSIPGGTAKDLNGKVARQVGDKKTKVFLHVGTNDTTKVGSEIIIDNIKSLVREAKSVNPDAEVAVCSIPSRTDNAVAFSRAEGINNRLSKFCMDAGAEFVDLRGYLVSCRRWRADDGVHYSEDGARIVGERIGELIDSFLW